MSIDPKFLKDVEENGWVIESVDKDGSCIAKCNGGGCAMRARIEQGGYIPVRTNDAMTLDVPIEDFNHARQVLRDRRLALRLTILEAEEAAGLGKDYLLKLEGDNYAKYNRNPSVETVRYWAAALGYQLCLRPIPLPPITRARIAQTRDLTKRQEKRFLREEQRASRLNRRGSA